MSTESGPAEVYEIPADALRRPWVSRSFVALVHASRNAPKQRVFTVVGPAILSLAVHAFLITSVIWTGAQAPSPRSAGHVGPGSSVVVSAEEPVMTLILINEPSPVRPEPMEIPLSSRGFAPLDLPITLLSPDASPAFDSDVASTSAEVHEPATDDSTIRSVLFGRYVGQIRARIERAWMRPRAPLSAASFSCAVQITQDRQGYVKEAALQSCNGDLRWQLSLVQAIQSASPLPAPPDPKVFADAVTMKFEAQPFGPNSNAQEYEPPTLVAQTETAAQQSNAQLRKFEQQLRSSHGSTSGSIELTITGAPPGGRQMPVAAPQQNEQFRENSICPDR
jgi:hypothetical protein